MKGYYTIDGRVFCVNDCTLNKAVVGIWALNHGAIFGAPFGCGVTRHGWEGHVERCCRILFGGQLAQYVMQDAAMATVFNFFGRVNAHIHFETDGAAIGPHRCDGGDFAVAIV